MDNRGSKLGLNIYNTVKEQRVDGYRYKKIFIIFKVYSNELRKKLLKKLSAKIYYDSPLNDLNSFNFNTRRSYSTAHGALCTNKHKIDELQIDP